MPLMHALVAGGADIIELGVPFSDPMADGPVIQRASDRALAKGVGLRDVLRFVQEFRQTDADTPVVLMGYANPIEHMGVEAFIASASEAGVDGVLVVDYPPEECEEFAASMKAHGMDMIFLLAPTSTDERIEKMGQNCERLRLLCLRQGRDGVRQSGYRFDCCQHGENSHARYRAGRCRIRHS